MPTTEYFRCLHLNHSKIVGLIQELDEQEGDCLFYVEEAMQDSQSLVEQIEDLVFEHQLDLEYSNRAENLLERICEVYWEYKQKSDKVLGFSDYGWRF